MPRPVPASTHAAALDRCTFQGLTTGRVSVSGHGITAPPARDLPEPWPSRFPDSTGSGGVSAHATDQRDTHMIAASQMGFRRARLP